ncbi:MAG: hypothetical protein LBS62_03890, partial [Clostridiales bacterium]|nr:hypothetical protein [Clostridiales bacterium]
MYQPLLNQLTESRYIRRPMKADLTYSAFERWQEKPVLKTRRLRLCEEFDTLRNKGIGTLHRDFTRTCSGEGSVRLDTPTATAVKNPTNRRYAEPGFIYPFAREDLTEYNRLSFWVYVEAPGFATQFVVAALHNAGKHIMPAPGRFEGFHHADVTPGQWTRVIWELPDIYRDNVTGVSVYSFIHGSLANASDYMSIYVDDMRLETVEPEKTRGWDLPAGSVAYCHSG